MPHRIIIIVVVGARSSELYHNSQTALYTSIVLPWRNKSILRVHCCRRAMGEGERVLEKRTTSSPVVLPTMHKCARWLRLEGLLVQPSSIEYSYQARSSANRVAPTYYPPAFPREVFRQSEFMQRFGKRLLLVCLACRCI